MKKLLLLTTLLFTATACQPQSVVNGNQNTNTNTATTTEAIDASDWKTYRNEEYGFEFKYPGDLYYLDYYPRINFYKSSDSNNSDRGIAQMTLWIYPDIQTGEAALKQRFDLQVYADLKEAVNKDAGVYGYEYIEVNGKQVPRISIGESYIIDAFGVNLASAVNTSIVIESILGLSKSKSIIETIK